MPDTKSKDVSIDEQLFSWEDWDVLDTMCFMFYNCTLRKHIGNYRSDTKIDHIVLDYAKGRIELYVDEEAEEPAASYRLIALIGGRITNRDNDE